MFFGSDNTAKVTPEVMAAVIAANDGYASSYGGDALTASVCDTIRDIFEAPDAAVYFVTTGIAANALSLATLTPSWSAIFCHEHAHIHEAECGAPEFYSGAKVIPVAGDDGRIAPDALSARFRAMEGDRIRALQFGVLSLTNATEAGTVYGPAQVKALTGLAKAEAMPSHMDGARFANAVAATKASPADLTWRAGIDALSFGGTKNGCMGVEAVILFDPAKAVEFEVRRKRAGHTLSKNRFLAAQMQGYLQDGLWLTRATHANDMAAELARVVRETEGLRLIHPVEANILFIEGPSGFYAKLRAAGIACYDYPAPEGRDALRLVTSWATTPEDVAKLTQLLAS